MTNLPSFGITVGQQENIAQTQIIQPHHVLQPPPMTNQENTTTDLNNQKLDI